MNTSLAVLGGSGAYHLLQAGSLGNETDCRVVKTPFGQSAPIHRFSGRGLEFLFLSRHGERIIPSPHLLLTIGLIFLPSKNWECNVL